MTELYQNKGHFLYGETVNLFSVNKISLININIVAYQNDITLKINV